MTLYFWLGKNPLYGDYSRLKLAVLGLLDTLFGSDEPDNHATDWEAR